MLPLALAAALAASAQPGLRAKLPPAPRQIYRIAWQRPFVPASAMEWQPLETGGVAADAATGLAIFGTRDGWIHAVRADRSLAWEFKAQAGFAGAPALAGGKVFAGSRDGRLYALALDTGKLLWTYDSKEELGTRPAVANGTVYVASLQDTVFAVDAETGAWRWHHRREARSGFSIRGAADVLVGEGAVYAGYSDGAVVALDPRSGRPVWERLVAPVGEQVDVDGLALADGRLYAAAYSGAVVALDPANGSVKWTAKVPGAHTLAAGKGLVFAAGPEGTVALSSSDGSTMWEARREASGVGTPALVNGWLLVPAAREGLRFIEASSGRTLRVFDPGEGVSGTPAILGGRLYVLSNGGVLLALDLR